MGDSGMALAESDLARIGEYVRGNLRLWMTETGLVAPQQDPVSNTMLLERVVRVESELSAQREILNVRFSAMDKRFSLLTWMMGFLVTGIGVAITLLAM